MKVVLANNFHYIRGGADRVFFDEMDVLSAFGHKVVPFSMNGPQNLKTPYSEFFSDLISYDGVSIFEKLSTTPKLIYSTDSKRRFTALLSSEKPDIIHAHNIYGRLTTSNY